MSVDSCMRPSVDDRESMQAVVDQMQLRMKKLGEVNARIRKQILRFADLTEKQRKEIHRMMQEAMQIGEDVQAGLKK